MVVCSRVVDAIGCASARHPNVANYPLVRTVFHCAAQGGRQKGIGKKVTQNEKNVTKSDRKQEEGCQKVTEKAREWPTPFAFAYPLLQHVEYFAGGMGAKRAVASGGECSRTCQHLSSFNCECHPFANCPF